MKIFTLLLISALVISGCGYTTSSLISGGSESIYIENFINKIKFTEEPTDRRMYIGYRSGMEVDITKAIIDRFILDGNLKVKDKSQSDLILKGELIDFRKEPLRYDTNDNIVEYRIKVSVNMSLMDNGSDKPIWKEKSFTGESIYRITGQYATTEEKAVNDSIKDLATRVVERTVEDW